MKHKINQVLIVLPVVLLIAISGFAQDSANVNKFHLRGYQEYMSIGINRGNLDQFSSQQLLHNRIDARWDITKNIALYAGLRTRLFYGDLVKTIPDFGAFISRDANDYWDLDALPVSRKGLVVHSVFDRLYGVFSHGDWVLTVGRQRINWGVATLWNPNDLFNAYNFTDFDYPERSGSDALRLTWYKSWNTVFEIAGKFAPSFEESTLAARAKFGFKTYDIQLIAAQYHRSIMIGSGFAGNFLNGSLRGELAYFSPYESSRDNAFTATIEYQRSTAFNLIYTFGGLYNSNGQKNTILALVFFQPTAANVYPYTYSAFVQGIYTIKSLTTCGLAVVYSINSRHPLFVSPSVTYSAAQNLDIDFVSQITAEKITNRNPFTSRFQSFYLRFKYTF